MELLILTQLTLFQNMLEASAESKYWNHSLIIQGILGVWFAASHQPWIVSVASNSSVLLLRWCQNLHFVFLELCARPEYVEMIYQEIRAAGNLDYESIDRLPILDSFIKESVRVNPPDKSKLSCQFTSTLLTSRSVGIRRKALKPFRFSHGGPQVAVGQIVCVSAWDLMHDEERYPSPNTFEGLRFVPSTHHSVKEGSCNPLRGSRFTDASRDFPIWGLGSKVW